MLLYQLAVYLTLIYLASITVFELYLGIVTQYSIIFFHLNFQKYKNIRKMFLWKFFYTYLYLDSTIRINYTFINYNEKHTVIKKKLMVIGKMT